MKKILIPILILFLGVCGTVRAGEVDSLLHELKFAKSDSAKYDIYRSLCGFYYYRDWRIAQEYIRKGIDCAKRWGDRHAITSSYMNLATLHSVGGNTQACIDTLFLALRIAEHSQLRDDDKAFAYSQLCNEFELLGENDKALEYGNEALKCISRKRVEDSLRKYAKPGVRLNASQQRFFRVATIIYNDIGLLHSRTNNIRDDATDLLKFAIKVAEAVGLDERAGASYSNLGQITEGKGKKELAIEYYKKAITIFKKCGNPRYQRITYHNLATLYLDEHNYNKAEEMINEALKLGFASNKENFMLYTALASIAGGKHDFAKAFQFMKKAEDCADGGERDKRNLTKIYSEIYEKSGNPTKALEYYKKYSALRDSVNTREETEEYVKRLAYFQVMKKDDEINIMKSKLELNALRDSHQRTQIIMLVGAAVALGLLVCALVVFIRYREQKKKQLGEKNGELETANAQLTEINATKDKFFSIIAHDLRNPIGSFRNVVELLHDDYNSFDEEERMEFLGMLKKSSEQVFELLENLLEWSRSQRGTIKFNPTQIDISAIAQLCVDLLTLTAEKKSIKLINSVPKSKFIYADAKLVTTIIRNLMSNSVKFTREGGEIEAGYSEHEDGEVEFFVRDTGVGMDAERVASLFQIDKSKSTNGTNGEVGTGLGLILCKEFVEMHGGKIWVESEVGIGSKFIFTLPQPEVENKEEENG